MHYNYTAGSVVVGGGRGGGTPHLGGLGHGRLPGGFGGGGSPSSARVRSRRASPCAKAKRRWWTLSGSPNKPACVMEKDINFVRIFYLSYIQSTGGGHERLAQQPRLRTCAEKENNTDWKVFKQRNRQRSYSPVVDVKRLPNSPARGHESAHVNMERSSPPPSEDRVAKYHFALRPLSLLSK